MSHSARKIHSSDRDHLMRLNVYNYIGPDNMHPKVLWEPADVVAKPLSTIFEKSQLSGRDPRDWKEGNNTPTFMKREKGRLKEYSEPYVCVWEDHEHNLLEATLKHV